MSSRKKFKVIDNSTGKQVKLKGKQIVMGDGGVFFVVTHGDYYLGFGKLSDYVESYTVLWKGEDY